MAGSIDLELYSLIPMEQDACTLSRGGEDWIGEELK